MNTELAWFKSSYSGGDGEACLEMAATPATTIHVRDSKDVKAHPALTFTAAPWSIFIRHIAAGGAGA
ncbi:DUF397 domain-containing protein [Streptomyces antnestii]|uniref:DUF397 domain-containing protein n=1 Tax=Streptomyces antnestii TaxID=2494256 RepID=A0A437P7L0_9ACTN|nr:DUF397 domain-containing protein [Streptomyces sp. San01]RVU18270.1 DUF397 domain-containing protein [Streptomyces sp. San01]